LKDADAAQNDELPSSAPNKTHSPAASPTCCSWCDQPLAAGRAETILVKIGNAVRNVEANKLDRLVNPEFNAEVCSICDQKIPPDKAEEIRNRLVEMTPKMTRRLAEQLAKLEAKLADTPSERKGPVVIRKYAKRRLYNTETNTYVTLEDLAAMVKSERDFVVIEAATGDDLTYAVLAQIIIDQESQNRGEARSLKSA